MSTPMNNMANRFPNGIPNPGPPKVKRNDPRAIPQESKAFRKTLKASPYQEMPWYSKENYIRPVHEVVADMMGDTVYLRIWSETGDPFYRNSAWFLQINTTPDSGERIWPGSACIASSLQVGKSCNPKQILESAAMLLSVTGQEVYIGDEEYDPEGYEKRMLGISSNK